jgi:hypothetical protein
MKSIYAHEPNTTILIRITVQYRTMLFYGGISEMNIFIININSGKYKIYS